MFGLLTGGRGIVTAQAIIMGVIVFLFGLTLGSFLNVCFYRIPKGLSIVSPPSACPSCGTFLKPKDLVPVFSYLSLKGRCRYCSKEISPRYMIVELSTGVIFVLAYLIITGLAS